MSWQPTQVPAVLLNARRILMVGQVPDLDVPIGSDLLRHVVRTHYRLFRPSLLDVVQPDTIVAPVIQPGWDCIDLARKLHDCSYKGTYVLDATPIPSLDMIRREVVAVCPALSVEILIRPA